MRTSWPLEMAIINFVFVIVDMLIIVLIKGY
jgi:hypothetical protein